MAPIVHIPTIEQDPHISHSLNALLSVIQGVSVCKNVTYWNFSDVRFLHPYFLSVLALYKQQCEKRVICQDVPADLRHFLADIYFELPLDLNANNCKSLLSEYSTKPYIPFCSFNNDNETVSGVSEAVSDSVLAQCPSVMRSPFSYAIGELMDNILEHSKGTKGYVFWLKSQPDNSIYLCLADNGQTIFGNYQNDGRHTLEIDGNEAQAIRLANEGYSTKNKLNMNNRGFGIRTSKRMLVSGLGGSFFMLSGGGFHRFDDYVNDYADISKFMHWNGTILLLRIPCHIPRGFNFYDYLE